MGTYGQNKPTSKLRRLEAWLKANPHDWLSLEDICVKFETTPKTATSMLKQLRARGLVVRSKTVYYVNAEDAAK